MPAETELRLLHLRLLEGSALKSRPDTFLSLPSSRNFHLWLVLGLSPRSPVGVPCTAAGHPVAACMPRPPSAGTAVHMLHDPAMMQPARVTLSQQDGAVSRGC